MTLPDINDGSRPSLFELDRYHSGELSDEDAAVLEARIGPAEQAHLDALEAARTDVAPFDAAALRLRASPSVAAPPATPSPANRTLLWLAPVMLLASALLLFVVVPRGRTVPSEPPPSDVLFRGGDVQLFVSDGGQLVPWEGEALGAGDVVGFRVDATGHQGVVLVSIDGSGLASVLWPEVGVHEPLRGRGQVPLPGTLTLDDAPGPEAFVAIYDTPAPSALARAKHVFEREGVDGLQRWADGESLVDLVVVDRDEVR